MTTSYHVFGVAAGLLMLGLCGCRPHSQPDATTTAVHTLADAADQTLFGAQFKVTTSAGELRGVIAAETAYVLHDATQLAFRTVRITFVSDSGIPQATLTADRASVRPSAGLVDLVGSLTLSSMTGQTVRAESGHYSAATNRVTMDSSVSVGTSAPRRVTTLTTDPTLAHITCTPAC